LNKLKPLKEYPNKGVESCAGQYKGKISQRHKNGNSPLHSVNQLFKSYIYVTHALVNVTNLLLIRKA